MELGLLTKEPCIQDPVTGKHAATFYPDNLAPWVLLSEPSALPVEETQDYQDGHVSKTVECLLVDFSPELDLFGNAKWIGLVVEPCLGDAAARHTPGVGEDSRPPRPDDYTPYDHIKLAIGRFRFYDGPCLFEDCPWKRMELF